MTSCPCCGHDVDTSRRPVIGVDGRVRFRGREAALQRDPAVMLNKLITAMPEVVDRGELHIDERTLFVQIHYIREALANFDGLSVETVKRRGYRLVVGP